MAQSTVQRVKIDISLSTILKVLAVVLGVLFIRRIQDVILLLFVVLILVTAVSTVVDRQVEQWKVPRWLAVAIVFGGGIALFIIGMSLIVPVIIQQTLELLTLPQVQNLLGTTGATSLVDQIRILYGRLPGSPASGAGVLAFFSSLFGGIVSVLTVLVLSLYLLLDEDGIRKMMVSLLPVRHKTHIVKTFHKVSVKLGSWLRGQLLLGVIIGLIDLVVLLAFGVPYALTLAIFAGLTELIPYIGPFLGLAAALFVALTGQSYWNFSPLTVAIGVTVGYLLVQQLESNFLVPKVMQRTVGLSPVVVIVAILIGAKLFGFIGIILSVPAAAIISVMLSEWPAIHAAHQSTRNEVNTSATRG